MLRKLRILMLLIVISIIGYFYYLNFEVRILPPSEKWSKEVLLDTGEINKNPKLIEHKDKFYIAFNDDKNINVLITDKLGKVLDKKTFKCDIEPLNICLLANKDNLVLCYIESVSENSKLIEVSIDDKLVEKERREVPYVNQAVQASQQTLFLAYDDFIVIKDYSTGVERRVEAPKNSLLSVAKYKDGFVGVYKKKMDDFFFFTVSKDRISEPRAGVDTSLTSRVTIFSSALSVKDDTAYVMAEYKYKETFAGVKLYKFSLVKDRGEIIDLTPDPERSFSLSTMTGNNKTYGKVMMAGGDLSNVVSSDFEESTSFLASTERTFGKNHQQIDLVEMDIKGKAIVNGNALSRSSAVSCYSSRLGDYVVFVDSVGGPASQLFMVSSREDFKAAHGGVRSAEILQAGIDTLSVAFSSIGYIFGYGALWIIPSLSLACILSIFEYKITDKKRKLLYILSYTFAFLLKLLVVYRFTFVRFGHILPEGFTYPVGVAANLIISSICFIYGYYSYKNNMEERVIPSNFASSLIIDSFITQLLFTPFMV